MYDAEPITPQMARIPADLEKPDRLLGPLTARQSATLAGGGVILYGGWWITQPVMSTIAYFIMITPVAGAVCALALGHRDGMGLDTFTHAAWRHLRSEKKLVTGPVLPLPAVLPRRWRTAAGRPPASWRPPFDTASAPGLLSLRDEGQAGVAICTTVNFDLHTQSEQQSLIAAFARWLNSTTGPVQILVRTRRVDLAPLATRITTQAPALPHPSLEVAARAHADFLTHLSDTADLRARQVLLVPREPSGRAGSERVLQRLAEARCALAGADVAVAPLNEEQIFSLLAETCNPESDRPARPGQHDDAPRLQPDAASYRDRARPSGHSEEEGLVP
ncbi:PrgI family protein [Streptomyces sp. AJS327]|uniref:PrgI family protein n=1 Tax=Streptomyces sp. AJS327 TaxID=2545265 RepID=UPI0015DE151C|nr:PrgI family protein [Streptomyces sp. AJS327]MBA0049785.1 PrgI family protein [Streptomyces sp. AJS327]